MLQCRVLIIYLSISSLGTVANVIPKNSPNSSPAITTIDALKFSLPAIFEGALPKALSSKLPYETKPTSREDYQAKSTSRAADNTRHKIWHRPRNPPFPESTPPPSHVLKNNSMCVFLGAALGICNSLTSGFATMVPSMQAQCLCYSSAVWSPNLLDDAVNQCAAYASTAAPPAYAPLADLKGFCSLIGDVKAPKNTSMITTSAEGPKHTDQDSSCAVVSNAFSSCIEKDQAFKSLDAIGQAKCLCYNGTDSRQPARFDNAVRSCAEEAPYRQNFSSISMLARLCTSIDNALGSSTLLPSTVSILTSMVESSGLVLSISGYSSSQVASLEDWTSLKLLSGSNLVAPSTVKFWPTKTVIEPNPTAQISEAPIKTLHTANPEPIPTSQGIRRKTEKWDVIWVSFCCAAVILFL